MTRARADRRGVGVEPVAPRAILVIDDNRIVADLMVLALRRLGHDVRVAFDGASALSTIEDFVPDVVLLDIGLPAIDGYEIAKRIRAALSPHEVHFVAMSGYGSPPIGTARRTPDSTNISSNR